MFEITNNPLASVVAVPDWPVMVTPVTAAPDSSVTRPAMVVVIGVPFSEFGEVTVRQPDVNAMIAANAKKAILDAMRNSCGLMVVKKIC